MAPPYAIIFIGDLEEQILQDCNFKPLVGGDILMIFFYYGSIWKTYHTKQYLIQTNQNTKKL